MANYTNVSKFKGLNNIADPLRLGLSWLTKADNVDISGTGAVSRRSGYTPATTDVMTSVYSTRDFKRMYGVRGGDLIKFNADMTSYVIQPGVGGGLVRWSEVDSVVYLSTDTSKLRIAPDHAVTGWGWPVPTSVTLSTVGGSLPVGAYQVACVFVLPDGRETGSSGSEIIDILEGEGVSITNIPQLAGHQTRLYIAPADSTVFQRAITTAASSLTWDQSSDSLGVELTTMFLDPPPATASFPTYWKGRMYLMEYLPADNVTVIWASQPLGYHLFNLNSDYIVVQGQGIMLAPHADGLIIGTTTKVFAYDGTKLDTVADYGVVGGHSWAADDDGEVPTILFWTQRGLCSGLPFSNLTRTQISVRCGLSAGVAVIKSDGAKRVVAALQKGGSAFNPRA